MDRSRRQAWPTGLVGLLSAVALLATAGPAFAEPGAQGSITVHETADSEATTIIDACQFYVRGHGVAGGTGAIVFLYAPDGPALQPAQPPVNFTGTANATGGFDFIAGPFQVPTDDDHGAPDLIYVNVTADEDYQEFSLEPDIGCPDSTEVPFFTSWWGIGLATLALAGAVMMLVGRRKIP